MTWNNLEHTFKVIKTVYEFLFRKKVDSFINAVKAIIFSTKFETINVKSYSEEIKNGHWCQSVETIRLPII